MNQCDTPEIPLLAYDAALDELISHLSTVPGVSQKPLMQALGEVLAETQQASINVPSVDNSAMDGYAFNTADLASAGATILPVSQRIAAGFTGAKLAAGTAARIFTGAPIPEAANTVIMQEQVELENNTISFHTRPEAGNNIRPAGNDIKAGHTILQKGTRLRAQDIGLAASVGLQSLPVFDKIRVGMFFTGDELVEPGQALAEGQIYDSNRYTLYGLLKSLGCDIVDLGLVGDTLEATKKAMLEASAKADLVVTCGGVSVGEEDHVRIAIEQLGQLHLWRLRIKPGKPLAFGQINHTAFIGLPGNPVSVFATFCLFVCPLIKTLQGRNWQKPVGIPVVAGFDWPKPDSRREFLRARLEPDEEGRLVARIYPNQDSGVLTSTVWGQGFVEIAEGRTLKAGDKVDYLPYAQFLD
ncbi:MAG: molybdopterin molybdotransferase MoeA [Gammaproteobacteria bacterium]|nr:molybdopterin molybdotransferase MoeA [Gammaproteobacteria bacterium]